VSGAILIVCWVVLTIWTTVHVAMGLGPAPQRSALTGFVITGNVFYTTPNTSITIGDAP
jgi:hypothetical protein